MGRLILVADDSSTIQKVIKIAFARYPVEIIEAASYIEALAATAQSRPEVLIIDASLPGSKGPDDFTKLRQEAGQVPVLLLIGTYEAVDEAAFRQAGFTHILKKPFDTADVTAKMEVLLGVPLMPTDGGSDRAMPSAAEPAPPLINSPRSDPARRISSAGPAQLPPPASRPPASLPPRSLPAAPLAPSSMAPQPLAKQMTSPAAAPSSLAPRSLHSSAPRSDAPRPFSGPAPTSLPPMDLGAHRPEHNTVVHTAGLPGLDADFDDFTPTAQTSPVDHIPTEIMQMPGSAQRLPPPHIPPPPSTDESQRGRRAFAGPGAGTTTPTGPARSTPLASPPPPPLSFNLEDDDEAYGNSAIIHGPTLKKGGGDRSLAEGLSTGLRDLLAEELPPLVRQAVEDYCERHFNSLAREIIAAELRRLAEDKARHLVDN